MALRARAVLRRWAASADPAAREGPQSELRDMMRIWDLQESVTCSAAGRPRRFELRELSSPLLLLCRLNSHQDEKFPFEPPSPCDFAVGVNRSADEVAGRLRGNDASPSEAALHWPAGLPRFWISIDARGPPGAPAVAVRRWLSTRTRLAWANRSDRPQQRALGRCLAGH